MKAAKLNDKRSLDSQLFTTSNYNKVGQLRMVYNEIAKTFTIQSSKIMIKGQSRDQFKKKQETKTTSP